MNIEIWIGIVLVTLLVIVMLYERALGKIVKENECLWKKLLAERKKSFQLKRQVEYYNIFLKEIELITKENNYNSAQNIENKIRGAIRDINRADKFLHFNRSIGGKTNG